VKSGIRQHAFQHDSMWTNRHYDVFGT
jgi:hypothetical protein